VIQVQKGAEPDVLRINKSAWTEEFMRLVAEGRGASFTRYRIPAIKDAILAETHKKCAYCESKMRHVAYGDVEHVLPKTARPDLVVEWSNLTLACDRCNTNKGTYFSEHEPLVHPHEDEPEQHLLFAGPMAMSVVGDRKGERTLLRLDLNHTSLVERRMEKLLALKEQIERWHELDDGSDRDLFARMIRSQAEDAEEYAATARDFLADRFPDLA
jgi:uncharacterized protein (TIGR02646 family)